MLVTHLPGYPKDAFEFCALLTEEADLRAVEYLVNREQPRIVIEVGAYAGSSTAIFASQGAKVFCVDHWQGVDSDPTRFVYTVMGATNVLDAFCRNAGDKLLTTIIPLVGSSHDWANRWPVSLKADMIYIDAGHKYTDAACDIMNWMPHLREGGLLAGHDYGGAFPGVPEAVRAIIGEPDEIFNAVWTWRKPVTARE